MKFSISNLKSDIPFDDLQEFDVWDDRPGGEIIEDWWEDGTHFVNVEFSHSTGQFYTFIIEDE